MDENKRKIKDQIITLQNEGIEIFNIALENHKINLENKSDASKTEKKKIRPIIDAYQSWYTKAIPVVKQILPDRFQEFQDQYKLQKRDDDNIDVFNFTLYDYLLGRRITYIGGKDAFDHFSAFSVKFKHQIAILASAIGRIESILTDIEGILQSSLFNHELESAEDLLKKGHLRAAGALSGVSLEIHLSRVCNNHEIKINKKSPTISDFNEALKVANVIDIPTWRHIQLLGDIRNLCVHA